MTLKIEANPFSKNKKKPIATRCKNANSDQALIVFRFLAVCLCLHEKVINEGSKVRGHRTHRHLRRPTLTVGG
jgi:hypothetical protein